MRFSFMRGRNNEERFHKNLFLDELDNNDDGLFSDYEYEYSDEEHSKYFKFRNLSLPLTDTIAEYVQGLTKDKFFLNDLSFVFEMSRNRAISPYAIIVALLYLKRLKTKLNPYKNDKKCSYCYSAKNLIDSYFNPKKENFENFSNTELCLISILLASKFLIDEGEDDEIYNDQWAESADIPVEKINKLEKVFLKRMEWELFVTCEEFWNFTNELTEKATRKKIKLQLGNCTYSDLEALLSFSNHFSLLSILKNFSLLIKIFFICSSTLLYITLSTYFVANGIIIVKNQLTSQPVNFIFMEKPSNPNNTFELNNRKFDLNNKLSYAIKNNQIEAEHTIGHQIKSIKLCPPKLNISTKIDTIEAKNELYILNQIARQAFGLIF